MNKSYFRPWQPDNNHEYDSAEYLKRMPQHFPVLILLAFLTLAQELTHAQEAEEQKPLRVLTKSAPPFVFDDEILRGFSVEFWREIETKLDLTSDYEIAETVPEMLSSVADGQYDVGIGAISVLPSRYDLVEFSHPIFNSGLQLMVVSNSQNSGLNRDAGWRTLAKVINWKIIRTALVVLVLLLAASHLIWLCERKINRDDFPGGYRHGISEAIWWSLATLISGGCENKAPVGIAGRLIAILWMLAGIGIIAVITAVLTSSLTVSSLNAEVSDLSELRSEQVGVISGTAGEKVLLKMGYRIRGYRNLDEAAAALAEGQVRGVVHDSPLLKFYAQNNAATSFAVVGSLFAPDDYAFIFPRQSNLRVDVNKTIIELMRSGRLERIKETWFGIDLGTN